MDVKADFVIAGPAGTTVASKLAAQLGLSLLRAEVRRFPDGESCVRIELPHAISTAVIVQGGKPPQDTGMIHFLQLIDILRDAGTETLIGVSPYLPYARQDRRSQVGEPETCSVWLDTLAAAGLDRLLTLEAHNPSVLTRSALRCESLSSVESIADRLRSANLASPLLLSPDEGGRDRLEAVARRVGWPKLVLTKSKAVQKTWFNEMPTSVAGRDVVVVDDLCSSGSTLIPLVAALRAAGAASVGIVVVHFLGERDDLLGKLDGVRSFLFSDSLDQADADFECAALFARAIGPLLKTDCRGTA